MQKIEPYKVQQFRKIQLYKHEHSLKGNTINTIQAQFNNYEDKSMEYST